MNNVENILRIEIKCNEIFWKMLMDLDCGSVTLDSLHKDIMNYINDNSTNDNNEEIKKHSITFFKCFLEEIKSDELNITKMMGDISDYIYKMRFKLRDISDSKKGIKRKPFYPEKLIGKTFSLKPYGTKNIEVFKINSIKRHSYWEYDDSEMVVYNVGNQRENGFPMFRKTVEELIERGRLIINPFENNPIKDTIEYKIL